MCTKICIIKSVDVLTRFGFVDWLCLTSHRERGHLEKAPPFTVPCEGHEARFLHPTGIEPWAVAWQSITQPLRHASCTQGSVQENNNKKQFFVKQEVSAQT